jgi:hypothetical protein
MLVFLVSIRGTGLSYSAALHLPHLFFLLINQVVCSGWDESCAEAVPGEIRLPWWQPGTPYPLSG